MHDLALLATIVVLHLLAVISPGPDFIMTVRNATVYSRKTGILTSIGLGLGIATHITYCLAGIALVISQSIMLFNVIKLIGAGYLIYIGFKSFMAKKSHIDLGDTQKKNDISPWKAVGIGYLTNVLNPKATLFFLSLFTLVIKPDTSPAVLAAASAIMVISTSLWFSLVAVMFTHKRVRSVYERFEKAINRTFGGILMFIGVKIALTQE